MIEWGRSLRFKNDYRKEVAFSKQEGFDFMQIWFVKGTLSAERIPEPKAEYIKSIDFPLIIHALFDIDDFIKYGKTLVETANFLEQDEIIIHPICHEKAITNKTIYQLASNVKYVAGLCRNLGITLFIENNSVIDPIHYLPQDLEIVFHENPDVELLLDIAHIHSYQHLQELIHAKFPKCIHLTDKHFSVQHEHLPIGKGDIDFNLVFSKYLKGYEGKIIFEIVDEDDVILDSKKRMMDIMMGKSGV